jgi:hypothetical protein
VSEPPIRRGRLFTAYAIVAAQALIVLVAALVLSSGSDSAARGNPHINLESGLTNGRAPDSRDGIEPPDLELQNLQKAARTTECELRLRLPNEGREHIPTSAPEPRYKTNPPTSGDHFDEQQADGAYRETPPPDMPYLVAATTWTNLMGCASYHEASTLVASRCSVEPLGAGSAVSQCSGSGQPPSRQDLPNS